MKTEDAMLTNKRTVQIRMVIETLESKLLLAAAAAAELRGNEEDSKDFRS